MRNTTMTAGVFTEYVYAGSQVPEVTRVDYGREGHELVVTVSTTPPTRGDATAVVRDGNAFHVLSTPDGALLTSIPIDQPVRWEGLRAESTPEGLRVRLPLREPRPIRVVTRPRPTSFWHRIRARMRRIRTAVVRPGWQR